jgi:SWI/SNF-related matrix-associated actin-dependent regulator 1 of chromatin subfamily A
MVLTYRSRVFIAECSYSERAVPKAAGFWWHGGDRCRASCAACAAGVGRVWWTDRHARAADLAEYADAAAKAALAQHRATLDASRAADADLSVPAPEGCEYLGYQRAGIAYALGRTGTLIADEMGLGKTIQALGLLNADPSIRSALIICPASLRLNWRREAERWLVRPRRIHVVESADPPPAEAEVVIANYDRVRQHHEALMSRQWDILVADEAHYLKNPKAQRTQLVLGGGRGRGAEPGLISRARRKLLLTGTPLLNQPVELWPLVHALDPERWPSFFSFVKRYCDAHQERIGRSGKLVWNFDGASNLGELQERLRSTVMVRRLKKDVLTELPPKRRQVVELPDVASDEVDEEERIWEEQEEALESAQAAVDLAQASGDERAYEAAVARLREAMAIAFTAIARARHAVAIAKVPAALEHIDSMLESGISKIVVFGHHHDVIAKLAAHYGARAVVLTGETPMAERQAAVDRFQSDPSCAVFIGSITAAGVGLTLTAASHVVFVELDWVPANVTQAEDRLHRIGQREHVLVQHLVVDGSLDARMAKTLVAKQAIADQALDRIATERARAPVLPLRDRIDHPTKYPPASAEQRAAAKRAMQMLAGVCDGAQTLDGAGFSRLDTNIGHSLAAVSGDYTDGQVWLAARLARKYRRQLPEDLLAPLMKGGES